MMQTIQINRCVNCMGETKGYPCPHCGFDPAKEAQLSFALPWNTILHGKYLVGRVMGQGGFGITYVGWDLSLEVKVAIKEFYPTGQVSRQSARSHSLVWGSTAQSVEMQNSGLECFLKEARKMARVDRVPQVVRVRETFHENGTAYIIMDFVQGETLKACLQREGPLPFDRAMEIFRPAIAAMEEVHKEGLIHRDLSPDNIMLEPGGGVRILDLGAAKDVNRGDFSMLVTKKGFSPVEQYGQRGGSGPWTDVYAMAATIYYTLTGILPPNAIERLDDDKLQWDLPALTPAREALQKALAVSSKNRTQSMAGLLAGLEQTQPAPKQNPDQRKYAPQPEPAPPPKPQPKPEPQQKQQSKPAAPPKKKSGFGLILCIAVLVFAVWKILPGTASPNAASSGGGVGSSATESPSSKPSPSPSPSSSPKPSSSLKPSSSSKPSSSPSPSPSPSQEETYVTNRAFGSGTYTGDWKNGKPNGQGTLTWSDGDKCEGNFVDGLLNGQGTYTWANGNKYVGDFVDGKRTGQGTESFSSGKYEGDFVDGFWDGQGTITWSDGDKYVGSFAAGERAGQGTYTWAEGDKYTGNFADSKMNGWGTYYYANGNKYEGNFVDDKRTGTGTFTWLDGTRYVGDFVDDKMSGWGTYYFSGGKYEGNYVNGSWNGQGTLTWSNGDKYVGDFVDGKRTGQGTYTWANGQKYVGAFVNGEITGWGTYYNADGSVRASGTWQNGTLVSS